MLYVTYKTQDGIGSFVSELPGIYSTEDLQIMREALIKDMGLKEKEMVLILDWRKFDKPE